MEERISLSCGRMEIAENLALFAAELQDKVSEGFTISHFNLHNDEAVSCELTKHKIDAKPRPYYYRYNARRDRDQVTIHRTKVKSAATTDADRT